MPVRFVLDFENAIVFARSKSSKGKGRRARVTFATRDGLAHGGKLDPPGSITDVSYAARVERTDVTLAEGVLAGTITAAVRRLGGEGPVTFVWTLDGRVAGGTAAGSFTTTRGGKEIEGGRFLGTARAGAVPQPGDSLCYLTLHDAVEDGKFLRLYLSARDGAFTHGFGATPNFNNATHEVDVSGLVLAGAQITGKLRVVVSPDPWVPRDHKPFALSYAIRARITDAEVTGTYTGTARGKEVRGALDGGFEAKAEAAVPERIVLKLENALTGGRSWHNRAFFTIEIEDGKIAGGKVWNNHTDLKGAVDGGSLSLEGETLSGTFEATVGPSGKVSPGRYTFTVDGRWVGDVCAGSFVTRLEGRGEVKRGRFWGSAKRAGKGAR